MSHVHILVPVMCKKRGRYLRLLLGSEHSRCVDGKEANDEEKAAKARPLCLHISLSTSLMKECCSQGATKDTIFGPINPVCGRANPRPDDARGPECRRHRE